MPHLLLEGNAESYQNFLSSTAKPQTMASYPKPSWP